jgi:hypothetical protein
VSFKARETSEDAFHEALELVLDSLHVACLTPLIPETAGAEKVVVRQKPLYAGFPAQFHCNLAVWPGEPCDARML